MDGARRRGGERVPGSARGGRAGKGCGQPNPSRPKRAEGKRQHWSDERPRVRDEVAWNSALVQGDAHRPVRDTQPDLSRARVPRRVRAAAASSRVVAPRRRASRRVVAPLAPSSRRSPRPRASAGPTAPPRAPLAAMTRTPDVGAREAARAGRRAHVRPEPQAQQARRQRAHDPEDARPGPDGVGTS